MSKQYLKVLLISIYSFCSAAIVCAQPVVQSVLFSNQQTDDVLIINGSGFGSGPNVVLYDTFERGALDQKISPDNAAFSGWSESSAKFSSLSSLSGRKSALVADGKSVMRSVFGVADPNGMHGLKHFTEVYFSYSIRDLGVFPGRGGSKTSFSNESSTKDAWMMFGNRGDNSDYSVSSLGEEAGHDLYIPGWTGGGFNVAGNETALYPSFWQRMIKNLWDFNGWNTTNFHAKLDVNNPYGDAEGFVEFLSDKGFAVNPRSGNFMSDQTADGVSVAAWDRIKFMAWMRKGDEVLRFMDDVYVAIGANSSARVLVTNAPSIDASTRISHLLPISWDDDQIVIDYSAASINGVDPLYLHVVNSSNVSASSGFLLGNKAPAMPPSFIRQTTNSN